MNLNNVGNDQNTKIWRWRWQQFCRNRQAALIMMEMTIIVIQIKLKGRFATLSEICNSITVCCPVSFNNRSVIQNCSKCIVTCSFVIQSLAYLDKIKKVECCFKTSCNICLENKTIKCLIFIYINNVWSIWLTGRQTMGSCKFVSTAYNITLFHCLIRNVWYIFLK